MNEHFARSGQRVEERIGSKKVVGIGGIDDSVGRTRGFRNLGKVGKCSDERLNSPERQLRCLVRLPHQAHDGVSVVDERSGYRPTDVAARPSHEDTHGILGPFLSRDPRSGRRIRRQPPYGSSSPLTSKIRFADGAVSAWIKTRAASGCLALAVTPAE